MKKYLPPDDEEARSNPALRELFEYFDIIDGKIELDVKVTYICIYLMLN